MRLSKSVVIPKEAGQFTHAAALALTTQIAVCHLRCGISASHARRPIENPMNDYDRRTFLKHAGAAVSAGAIAGPDALTEPLKDAARALDPVLLRSLGDAVLPESLTEEGREAAVVAFEVWLAGFQPVAELRHPYGGDVVPYGPPDPEPGWSAQLDALNLAAGARHGSSFAGLDRSQRRAILDQQVEDEGQDFPLPARARHVAVGLMAHYFGSPAANDLCYGRRIDRETCRSTDGVSQVPPPLGA